MSRLLDQLTLPELQTRTSAKWRVYEPEVLPMWVAEMDVALAEPIVAAVRSALDRGDTGYPVGDGYSRALADFAEARWSWRFAPEHSLLVPDVMSGIADAIRVVTAPGAGVIVNPPVYPPFFSAVSGTGRRLVSCPLGPAGRLDLEALEVAMAQDGAEAFLLCSPHNPTGVVHDEAELTRVAELAEHHEVTVIADEIHAALVYPGIGFVPYLSVAPRARALVAHSASKAWNLAGLKAAALIAGERARADLSSVAAITHAPSHLGVIAQTAALAQGTGWLDQLLADLDRNRGELARLLAEVAPEVGFRPPEATYLGWLDFRRVLDEEDPAIALLESGRVALNPGPSFGEGGAGHARINFACPAAVLAEGVARIARVAGNLRSD